MKHQSTHNAFHWNDGTPSVIGLSLSPSRKDRSAEAKVKRVPLKPAYSAPIEGSAAGQASSDRRDALRRGGI